MKQRAKEREEAAAEQYRRERERGRLGNSLTSGHMNLIESEFLYDL